jgi:hypothetical protein
MLTLCAPLTWVLRCVVASLLPLPCARLSEPETPKPWLPYDTPTLALFASLVLRVAAVSVLRTSFT